MRRRVRLGALDRAVDDALVVDGERPPYAEFALTLYAFVSRLRRELESTGADRVLLCAREGQFLQRLFLEHNRAVEPAAARVDPKYFYVSRRATLIPSLQSLDDEDFGHFLSSFRSLTNAGFEHSLGLTGVLDASTIDPDAPLDLGAIRADRHVAAAYEDRRIEQKQLLGCYVESLTGSPTADVHMVDVGWRGSIQDHVRRAVGDRREVHGYYLGLVAERPIEHLDHKRALIFGPTPEARAHYRVLKHFKNVWEFVLGADHGSVVGYRRDADGAVVPVLDPHEIELAEFERVVRAIQTGLFEIFARLCSLDGLAELDDDQLQDLVARRHARMMFFPTRTELEISRSRGHYANFGDPWVKEVVAYERPTATERIKNLATLVRSPRIVFEGYPPLKLHRMGLNALIPVVGGYRTLREFPPGWRTAQRPR